MRPVHSGDVMAAARALLPVPPPERQGYALSLVREAEEAEQYRQDTGCAHPDWGDGTLQARALADAPPKAPLFGDPAFLHCHLVVIETLLARQTGSLSLRSHAH